jgi:excisionase family DNA binding protein
MGRKITVMEKVVFTALTKQDLEALVIDCVQVCLKRHAAQQPAKRDDVPGQAASPYVSKREAARLLSCSPSTIDNHARAGHLTRHYIGKAVRFDRVQVLNLAKRHSSTKQYIQQ